MGCNKTVTEHDKTNTDSITPERMTRIEIMITIRPLMLSHARCVRIIRFTIIRRTVIRRSITTIIRQHMRITRRIVRMRHVNRNTDHDMANQHHNHMTNENTNNSNTHIDTSNQTSHHDTTIDDHGRAHDKNHYSHDAANATNKMMNANNHSHNKTAYNHDTPQHHTRAKKLLHISIIRRRALTHTHNQRQRRLVRRTAQ